MLLRYAGMGVELAAAIIGLTLLGLWVDYRFQTGPIGMLIGVGVGVVGGFYNFVRDALRLSREKDLQTRRDRTQTGDEHHESS